MIVFEQYILCFFANCFLDPTLPKSAILLVNNPTGLVPVVIDRREAQEGEVVVYESLICVEFVDEAMGDKPTLLPGSPSQRALARMWANKLDKEICTQFYVLLKQQNKEGQEKAAERILNALRDFSDNCKGPFFFGEQFSLVEIALAPWGVGVRMDILKHYRDFEVPRTEEYAKYWDWVAAVSKRPSFFATASSDLPAMKDVYLPYAEGM